MGNACTEHHYNMAPGRLLLQHKFFIAFATAGSTESCDDACEKRCLQQKIISNTTNTDTCTNLIASIYIRLIYNIAVKQLAITH